MTCVSTVELRRLCKPPLRPDTFGCYIDVLRTRHDLTLPFWPLAQDVAFKLIGAVARNQDANSILQLPSYGAWAEELLPVLRSGLRLDGIGVTSAGETGLGRVYGAFELDDITMLVSSHLTGPTLFATGMEREGSLSLGICYAARTIATSEVEALADRTVSILRNLPVGP